MTRKLFGEGFQSEDKDSDRKEYKAPEEKPAEIEIPERLVEHYINEKDSGGVNLWEKVDFKSEVKILEPLIKDTTKNLEAQKVIDSLTLMLRDESERRYFSRTEYLTGVVQALYNLGYNDFVINLSDWPEDNYNLGQYLEGRQEKPLIVDVYGDFEFCGLKAKYCEFIVRDNVEKCGGGAKDCSFTLYNKIKFCGEVTVKWKGRRLIRVFAAENCTFNLMPSAEIRNYRAKQFYGNVLRRLDEKGEVVSFLDEQGQVMIIPTLHHRIKSIFR